MSTSSFRIEKTLKQSSFLMMSLHQVLMDREREVCLEPQVTHDILLETCSKMRRGVEVEPLWTWEVTVQNTVRAIYWIRLT